MPKTQPKKAPTKSPDTTPRAANNPAAPKDAEKELFKLWLATPSWARTLKTQKELAVFLHVDDGTLSDWKRNEGFMDAVVALARQLARQHTPQIIEAMRVAAEDAKDGTAADRKLWLQYLESWVEKSENVAPPQTIVFERPANDRRPKRQTNPA